MAAADFWYEFASTYSYPASMRIEALAASRGVALHWRPFLLGPIFAAQGHADSPFNLNPAKGRYMWGDLQRICASLGLPLRRPDPFPQNSLLAARVALVSAACHEARSTPPSCAQSFATIGPWNVTNPRASEKYVSSAVGSLYPTKSFGCASIFARSSASST